MFSCNSIGAPSNCKNEFAGAAVAAVGGAGVTALDGAVDDAVVAVLDGAVDGAAKLATTGLAATAPAAASLCAKTVEATHYGQTTTAKAQPKVWCCVAADFINGAL